MALSLSNATLDALSPETPAENRPLEPENSDCLSVPRFVAVISNLTLAMDAFAATVRHTLCKLTLTLAG